MRRVGLLSMLIAAAALLALAPSTDAQTKMPASKPAPAAKTAAWKIQNAMSAAPRTVAKDATIMDWPAKEGDEPTVLRKGTNEWTCFPDDPGTPGNDPMCLDKMWMVWAQGWMTKKAPKITAPGMAYMLQGGSTASNSDPFAKKADHYHIPAGCQDRRPDRLRRPVIQREISNPPYPHRKCARMSARTPGHFLSSPCVRSSSRSRHAPMTR